MPVCFVKGRQVIIIKHIDRSLKKKVRRSGSDFFALYEEGAKAQTTSAKASAVEGRKGVTVKRQQDSKTARHSDIKTT